MSITIKPPSDLDSSQNTQHAFNDVNSSHTVDGFLTGLVGRRVDLTIATTNVTADTENYSFSELGVALYTLQIVYTDGTRTQLLFAQRTA